MLKEKNILLRPFELQDISSEYLSWLNDPKVVRFSNQRFRTHTQKSATEYTNSFSNSESLFYAILLVETQSLVGTITAYCHQHHQTADMGLLIGDRNFWGCGIGLSAWCMLQDHLFNVCNMRKVTGGTLRCNIGMVKIMERSGMKLEAVRKKQEIVDEIAQDALYYAKFNSA